MTGCLYCIDNDIIKKLATFELFDETINLFEADRTEIRVLATAKYKFRGDLAQLNKGKCRRLEAKLINYKRTIELAETLPQISQAEVNSDLFGQLSGCEGIDAGEAILTTYVAQVLQKDETGEAFILTGDKRYLRALAQAELPELQALFANRFWCLEQLILRDIREYGFEVVRDKIVPVRDCDKACKAVFGSGAQSTEENVLSAIAAYIETLRAETGNLLHEYGD
ncbi:MAG: Uncharacterized protein family (UPF0179) [Phormidesmis priestleyi Ana]|uniref:Uncharacterized protein family (UPF0179) n=1 Tax=Phormidesmis priestleyi Ana TaxID=1666911 RepID=A0A0P7YRJ4_9CYAN|nr:MAG: Uncharacterized protein family (UPF0179) [Phormidesmis priestleyi Ana]